MITLWNDIILKTLFSRLYLVDKDIDSFTLYLYKDQGLPITNICFSSLPGKKVCEIAFRMIQFVLQTNRDSNLHQELIKRLMFLDLEPREGD